MDHALNTRCRGIENSLVGDVSGHDLDPEVLERLRFRGSSDHGPDRNAVFPEPPDEMPAHKAGAAGDEDHGSPHRKYQIAEARGKVAVAQAHLAEARAKLSAAES